MPVAKARRTDATRLLFAAPVAAAVAIVVCAVFFPFLHITPIQTNKDIRCWLLPLLLQHNTARQEMSQVPFYARLKMRLNIMYFVHIHIHIQAHTKNSQIIIIWIHAFFILRMSNNNECAAVVVNEDDTATDECECAWWKMSVSLLWLPHQTDEPHTTYCVSVCVYACLCQPAVWHNGTHKPHHSEMARL